MTQGLVQVILLLTFLFSVEAAQCPGLCSDLYIPVCTTDNQTYPNQCTADCANATVTCKHACPCAKPKSMVEKVDDMKTSRCICPAIYAPVCTKGNKTYSNQCIAECSDAIVTCKHACPCGKQKSILEEADKMAKSKCPGLCIDIYDPVCTKNNQTYPNQCIADCDNATVTCKHACPCAKPKSMVEEVEKMAKEFDRAVLIARCNCTDNFKPVCTDDEQTLPNQCIAECINATVACKHACPCGKPNLKEEELEVQGEYTSSRRHLLVLFSCSMLKVH
jgi:hypothetical protein